MSYEPRASLDGVKVVSLLFYLFVNDMVFYGLLLTMCYFFLSFRLNAVDNQILLHDLRMTLDFNEFC